MSAFDLCCVHSVHRPWAPNWFGLTIVKPGEEPKLPFDGQLLVTVDYQPYKEIRDGRSIWRDRLAFFRTNQLRCVRAQYWVSLDDDVQVDKENLDLALDYAWKHPSLGCVGIPCIRGDQGGCRSGTVHMGCAVWQTAATEGLSFRTTGEDGNACECFYFNEDVKARGWGIIYHPTATAVHWEG